MTVSRVIQALIVFLTLVTLVTCLSIFFTITLNQAIAFIVTGLGLWLAFTSLSIPRREIDVKPSDPVVGVWWGGILFLTGLVWLLHKWIHESVLMILLLVGIILLILIISRLERRTGEDTILYK